MRKWDAWNRLIQVKDGETTVALYAYDGLNHRITKTVGETITHAYYNASWQLLETREGAGAPETLDPKTQYVWSLRYIDAPVLRWRDTDDDGDLDETLYLTNDANMNVTALVEPDGDVVERVVYDPYGKPKFYDGSWQNPSDTSEYDNTILYCGYYFDDESGLYSVRHRYYHPPLGRWLSRDPSGYADGMSLYEYVGSGPMSAVDAMGFRSIIPMYTDVSGRRSSMPGSSGIASKGCGDQVGLEVILESDVSSGVKGGTFWLGIEMLEAGQLRIDYDEAVRQLRHLGLSESEAGAARAALQKHFYMEQNALGRAVTKRILQERLVAGRVRSMNNPFTPNAGITGKARFMCNVGKSLVLLSITLDVVEITTAPEGERGDTAAKVEGRWAGAYTGGKAGALACAWGGPWGVGICGFIGAVIGGVAGEAAFDPANTDKILPPDQPMFSIFGIMPIMNPNYNPYHGGGSELTKTTRL